MYVCICKCISVCHCARVSVYDCILYKPTWVSLGVYDYVFTCVNKVCINYYNIYVGVNVCACLCYVCAHGYVCVYVYVCMCVCLHVYSN